MSYNAIKEGLGLCTGARKGFSLKCNGTQYKCVCGAIGCKQTYKDGCSNQNFDAYGACLKCGKAGQYEAVS